MEDRPRDGALAAAVPSSLRTTGRSVRPAVVGVTTIHRRAEFDEDGDTYASLDGLPPAADIASYGTGVVYDPAGLVLTALHVVADPEQILVQLPEHGTREAVLVGADPSTDLAVLRLETLPEGAERFAAASVRPDVEVLRGDWVFALDDPGQEAGDLLAGRVGAVDRHLLHAQARDGGVSNDYLMVDAVSEPGRSGSPVFDEEGHVVGLLTRAGRQAGESYALTARTVQRVLDAMERGEGKVARAHMGLRIDLREGDAEVPQGMVPEGAVGVVVAEAIPGYSADRAGLEAGDVITRFDGRVIPSALQLHEWITWSEPGTVVELEILRDSGRVEVLEVTLGTLGDPPGGAGE